MEERKPLYFLSTRVTHDGRFEADLFSPDTSGMWKGRRSTCLPRKNRQWHDGPWLDMFHWQSCTREMVEAYAGSHLGEWYPGLVEAMEAMLAKQAQVWELAYTTFQRERNGYVQRSWFLSPEHDADA